MAFAKWEAAVDRLARLGKIAQESGPVQIKINMARVMGDRTLDLIEAILSDLGLSPDDPAVDRVVSVRLAEGMRDEPLAIEP